MAGGLSLGGCGIEELVEPFATPPTAVAESTFGQLETVGGSETAAHYLRISLDPPDTAVLTPASGVLEFSNDFEDLGHCYLLTPSKRLDLTSQFQNLDDVLPKARTLTLALCGWVGDQDTHPAYAAQMAVGEALFDGKLESPTSLELELAARSFFSSMSNAGYQSVDAVADPSDLTTWTNLGATETGELIVAAFQEKGGIRTWVNPAPYLAEILSPGLLDGQPPTIDSIVLEEAPTSDFDEADIQPKTFDSAGNIDPPLPLGGYIRASVGLTVIASGTAGGPTVVPYEIGYELTQLTHADGSTVDPADAVRSRATVHLDSFERDEADELSKLFYRTTSTILPNTDPGTHTWWLHLPWRIGWPPDDADQVRDLRDEELSCERPENAGDPTEGCWTGLEVEDDGTVIFEPGGTFELEVFVRDAFQDASARDSKTVFFEVSTTPSSPSSPVDFDVTVTHAVASHPEGDLVASSEWSGAGFWLRANRDDDDGDTSDDADDAAVNGDDDLADLASVEVGPLTGLVSADARVYLRVGSVSDGQLRVFEQTGTGAANAVERLDTGSDSSTGDADAEALKAALDAGSVELLLEGVAEGGVEVCIVYSHDGYEEPRCLTVRVGPWFVLDLDVDADRSGAVTDADEDLEDTIDLSVGGSGVILAANADDDDGDGTPDHEDSTVSGAADMADLLELVLAGSGLSSGELTALGWTAELRLANEHDEAKFVRIFDDWSATAAAWLDDANGSEGPGGTYRYRSTPVDGATARQLGMEVRRFRGCFGAACDVSVSVVEDVALSLVLADASGQTVAYDRVLVTLAPFLLRSNLTAGEDIYYEDDTTEATTGPGFTDGRNADVDAKIRAAQSAGKPVVPSPLPDIDDVWFQDQVEIGYSVVPGGSELPFLLQLPRKTDSGCTHRCTASSTCDDEMHCWYADNFLSGNEARFAIPGFEPYSGSGLESKDFGGNIEVTPPVPGYDLGRVFIGNNASDALLDFLEAQHYQRPVTLPVDWLSVGHVDEVASIIPDGDGVADVPDFKIALADPALAKALLEGTAGFAWTPDEHAALFAEGSEAHGEAAVGSGSTSLKYSSLTVRYYDGGGTAPAATSIDWNFVRIYDGKGAGQVAHIVGSITSDTVTIDRVWDLPTSDALWTALCETGRGNAQSSPSWFDTPDDTSKFVLVETSLNFSWLKTDTSALVSDHVVENGRHVEAPALFTVKEILADSALWDHNADLQACLRDGAAVTADTPTSCYDPLTDPGLSTELVFSAALHASNAEFVPLPVIYSEVSSTMAPSCTVRGRGSAALVPNLVNLQAWPDLMLIPRPFGPRNNSGEDLFEAYAESVLPAAVTRFWVDTWDALHTGEGEIHCGTNLDRSGPGATWYEAEPP